MSLSFIFTTHLFQFTFMTSQLNHSIPHRNLRVAINESNVSKAKEAELSSILHFKFQYKMCRLMIAPPAGDVCGFVSALCCRNP